MNELDVGLHILRWDQRDVMSFVNTRAHEWGDGTQALHAYQARCQSFEER